jgi:hypothetical protein
MKENVGARAQIPHSGETTRGLYFLAVTAPTVTVVFSHVDRAFCVDDR